MHIAYETKIILKISDMARSNGKSHEPGALFSLAIPDEEGIGEL